MKEKQEKLTLTVKARLEDAKDKKLPDGIVYVYDQSGRLVVSRSLPQGVEREASLDLPAEMLGHTVRVLVGPAVKQQPRQEEAIPAWMEAPLRERGEFPEAPALAMLKRLGAVEKTVRLEAKDSLARLVAYPFDWTKWLTCHCVVRGRLIKRVPMPDGTVQDWGVFHACILIYEVDAFPYIIARLPELELFRLRDDLLDILKKWPPFPPERLEKIKPRHWPPPPPPPAMAFHSFMSALPEAAEEALPVYRASDVEQKLANLESIAHVSSAVQLRSELIAHGSLVVKLLCVLPWFMHWFSKDLIRCTCTDEQGYFETTIPYTCGGDHPDLYFKAVQCIGGTLHTLYDPGMVCHTHWNYPCGTEVVLETIDPAARVCAPRDPVIPPAGVGTWVLINRVAGVLINNIGSDGLVGYDFVGPGGHVTATGAPFGATLGLRVSHSLDIPTPQLKYYRWLYNKDGEVDAMGDPVWHEFGTPVAPSVGRHYADFDQMQPTKPPTFPVYTLGPKSVNNKTLYEFRPHQVDLQATAPPNHVYQWPVEPIGNDIYSGLLDSRSLPGGVANARGKYWFKLEVYDNNGNPVPTGASTFQFIVLTTAAGDTRMPAPGEIQDGGFVFCLHIDNRVCEAVIDAPSIAGTGADPNCGFLHHKPGDQVKLGFHALHPAASYGAPPANRATFDFWIRRGASVIKSVGGETAASSAGDWTGDHDGNFTAEFAPDVLLGPCTQASFAEILRVYAKATNGWRRLHEYDAGTEWAFALTPKKK